MSTSSVPDLFLSADMAKARNLTVSGKTDEALAFLSTLEVAEPHASGRALHIWFQVTVEKIRCYTARKELDQALALATQLTSATTVELTVVNEEFWVSGFVAVLLNLMRAVDRFDFMTNESFRAYRDFIEANKHLDDNRKGVRVYALYALGADLAREKGDPVPTGEVFDKVLPVLTQDTIDLLAAGHILLLDFFRYTMIYLGELLKRDAVVMEQVMTFSNAVAGLPRP